MEHDAEATPGARRSGILLVMPSGTVRRALRRAPVVVALGGYPDAAALEADIRRYALAGRPRGIQ